MEKTTKIKFGKTTKTDVETFLKPKQKEERSKPEGKEGETEQADTPKMEGEAELTGIFAIVDPIDTCVGPIGKFPVEPDVFPIHPSVGLFGKRRTGKTFTLRWWMYKCFRDYPFGVVFTNTSINGFWQKYVPAFLVNQGMPMHKLDALIARQKKLIAEWKKNHKTECDKDPDAYKKAPELRAFVIFDDVISDRVQMQWNKDINTFFVEGRHLCITVFITTQHVKGIGPMLRGNLDIACIQPVFQREARMVLADLYAGFMERNDFLAMMDKIVMDVNLEGSTPQDPKKYVRTLIVNDFENNPNPQLKFHWSEAENPDDLEDWRLCDDEYWKEQENQIGHVTYAPDFDPADELEEIFNPFE